MEMICPYCHKSINSGANKCPYCCSDVSEAYSGKSDCIFESIFAFIISVVVFFMVLNVTDSFLWAIVAGNVSMIVGGILMLCIFSLIRDCLRFFRNLICDFIRDLFK